MIIFILLTRSLVFSRCCMDMPFLFCWIYICSRFCMNVDFVLQNSSHGIFWFLICCFGVAVRELGVAVRELGGLVREFGVAVRAFGVDVREFGVAVREFEGWCGNLRELFGGLNACQAFGSFWFVSWFQKKNKNITIRCFLNVLCMLCLFCMICHICQKHLMFWMCLLLFFFCFLHVVFKIALISCFAWILQHT